MTARRTPPPALTIDRLISLGGLVGVFIAGFFALLNLTSTITQKFTEVQGDVKAVSNKVDTASTLAQQKVDTLKDTVDRNHQDVVQFQSQVTDAFKRVFDAQQKQSDAIQQERVDRLTDGKKVK